MGTVLVFPSETAGGFSVLAKHRCVMAGSVIQRARAEDPSSGSGSSLELGVPKPDALHVCCVGTVAEVLESSMETNVN